MSFNSLIHEALYIVNGFAPSTGRKVLVRKRAHSLSFGVTFSSTSKDGTSGGNYILSVERQDPEKILEQPSPFANIIEQEAASSSAHRPKRIPINQTPRGQLASKTKITSETNHTANQSNINGLSIPSHSATHFIRGGTPCDPAPPPFRLALYGNDSLYTLVLLRHGESEWNSKNLYTGWCDVNLTKNGELEARAAGRLLKENDIQLDHAFTSVLKRAVFTTNMALNMAGQHWVPVTKSWRLNERHYGALQGYNKDTAYQELGIDQELVMEMRRSYDTRPPRMMDNHPYWHGQDRRYKELSAEQLDRSRAESLKDTADRILPFFHSQILPSIRAGNKCIIVSHANTLRTLIKHIDNISDQDIKGMSIPTGIPLLYRLDYNLRPVDPEQELEFRYMAEPKGYTWATSRAYGFHGVYLGDLARLQEIQKKRDATNRDWQRIILRNLFKSLDEEEQQDGVVETRALYFQVHEKMRHKEFGNMLLLARMKDQLESLMKKRRQRYLTQCGYESIVNKLHLDAEGHIVEPFVALTDKAEREKRAKDWYEMLALDLEEECLIK